MTIWVLSLIALCTIVPPFLAEAMRRRMDETARYDAPGRFAALPQGETHFQWLGPKDGPVAVCVHGLTTPSYVWDPIAEHLAQHGFRVLTYDLYGRGFSDRAKGKQDSAFFTTQLNALLADQGIDQKLHLFGYSMGGAIATAFGGRHPEKLERLCIIAPAGYGDDLGPMARFASRTGIFGYWYMLVFYGRSLRRSINAERQLLSAIPDIFDRQIEETHVRGFHRAVWSSLRGIMTENLEPAQKVIEGSRVPTLAIWAEKDDVIPLTGKDLLVRWNRNAENVVIKDAQHTVAYTDVEEVTAAIDRFLAD